MIAAHLESSCHALITHIHLFFESASSLSNLFCQGSESRILEIITKAKKRLFENKINTLFVLSKLTICTICIVESSEGVDCKRRAASPLIQGGLHSILIVPFHHHLLVKYLQSLFKNLLPLHDQVSLAGVLFIVVLCLIDSLQPKLFLPRLNSLR